METTNVMTCDLGGAYSSRCSVPFMFTCPTNTERETNGAFWFVFGVGFCFFQKNGGEGKYESRCDLCV